MYLAENWQYIETVYGKDIGEDLAGSTGGRRGGSRRRSWDEGCRCDSDSDNKTCIEPEQSESVVRCSVPRREGPGEGTI